VSEHQQTQQQPKPAAVTITVTDLPIEFSENGVVLATFGENELSDALDSFEEAEERDKSVSFVRLARDWMVARGLPERVALNAVGKFVSGFYLWVKDQREAAKKTTGS
jgi:hypothetical protein